MVGVNTQATIIKFSYKLTEVHLTEYYFNVDKYISFSLS